MSNVSKKEVDTSRSSISELKLLLSSFNEMEVDNVEFELTKFVKRILSEIFLFDSNFTFEDLKDRIENFEKVCQTCFDRIEGLNSDKEELIQNSKGKKKDKEFYEKLKTITESIDNENENYQQCTAVAKILDRQHMRQKISDYVSRLQEIQFSKDHITKKELNKMIFEFLWILNHFPFHFHRLHHEDIITKIKDKIKFAPIESGHANLKLMDLPDLVVKAREAVHDGEMHIAIDIYDKILHLYVHAPHKTKNDYYKALFDIWFNIYFHEYIGD